MIEICAAAPKEKMAVAELQMIDVDTGDLLGTIRLVGGRIVTDTDAGRAFIAGRRAAAPAVSDADLVAAYADWSDGTIALHPTTRPISSV